jgi:UDP-N-acetylmuramoyl-L-alanyl-D-glutamate--2,6-diaminopimelate ligase
MSHSTIDITIINKKNDDVSGTFDNDILNDMEQGLTSAAKRKYIKIVDRREAIKAAISFANPGDIILVAGKGHEKYQDIKGVKTHFDDKETLFNLFKELEK